MREQLIKRVDSGKQSFIPVLVILILFGFRLAANADTLYLKNGRNIEGVITKEDEHNVSLEVNCGIVKFSKEQINSIERSSTEDVQLIRQGWVSEKEALAVKTKEIRQKQALEAKQIQEKQEHEPKQAVLDKQNGQVTVMTMLNKKVQANLVLDTGASCIALSSKIAAILGIDTTIHNDSGVFEMILADGRKVKAKRIILDTVSVQGSEVEKVEAAVLPEQVDSVIAHDGLLGMSFLKNFNFKIDQKSNKLTLERI
ncbi:MAG: retropepsin-like aspartic protease [Candidatus Omnitrophica bacterium]|nr:retropepsin-like aspartic protease [Candidatus Omnitrophota bacterium]